ncbi:MAG TPA: GAF domain-containing sensor histidine kinase [Anaerolineae bacterium]|nr:GAF domain-containing sensor histidine kinase [Anaerolineae bacterium]
MPDTIGLQSDAAQLRRRNRELAILNAVAEALNHSVDINQALQTTLVRAAELLDLQTGWIWLLSEGTEESYLAASLNLPPALANNPARMEGWCYCLDTYRQGDLRGAANVNVITCSRLQNLVDGTDGLRYHASIPLYAPGGHVRGGERRKLGVLNVASPEWRELSAEDLRILHTIGDLLSIAIERARLYARSAEMVAVEERNRLAREIHDTLAQGLTAIALKLETADLLAEAGADPARVRQAVQDALALARANLDETRRSVLDLRAAPLEGQGLIDALRALLDGWTARHGVEVDLQVIGAGRPLPVRVEVGLYRIAQEALNNVARHAGARHVILSLTATPAEVRLVVEDDGRGFDPDEVAAGRYGLVGLNERARLLGGRLRLESTPGEGTRVQVVVPLEPE